MPIAFAPSPRSTLGLEWELALVDQRTRELTNIAPELLPALQQHFPTSQFPHLTGELLQNTMNSSPRHTGALPMPPQIFASWRSSPEALLRTTEPS